MSVKKPPEKVTEPERKEVKKEPPEKKPPEKVAEPPCPEDFSELDDYKEWESDFKKMEKQASEYGKITNSIRRDIKKILADGPQGYAFAKAKNAYLEATNKQKKINFSEWSKMSVENLDIPKPLLCELLEKFETLGDVDEWASRSHRDNVQGIGQKDFETIQESLEKLIAKECPQDIKEVPK